MMKGVFYEKLKTETLQQEQITIKTGEGKLIGIGFYKSEEDFKKSSNSVKKNVFRQYEIIGWSI